MKCLAFLLVLATLSAVGCGSITDPWADKGGPPRVLVTFPPLTSWVNAVGGDRVGVLTLCDTTGPHEYQFNVQDALKLKKANLFVANGLGLDDHFVDRLRANSNNRDVRVRKLAETLAEDDRLKTRNYDPNKPHEHKEGEECDCAHGPYDPHAWLGITRAAVMVRQIGEDLAKVDDAHAAEYLARAKDYVERLEQLHAEGKKKLEKLNAALITSHAAMGYFANNFGLKVAGAVRGLDGQDSGRRHLFDLIEECKGFKRVVITVEPQYPRKTAEVLGQSLKSKGFEVFVVELDPLETCEKGDDLSGDWYIDRMRANIDALAKHAK